MHPFEETKKIYQATPLPTQLNSVVNHAIDTAMERRNRHNLILRYKPLVYSTVAACTLFVALLNASPAFAANISQVPVINKVAQLFTFREYNYANEGYDISITAPNLQETGHTDLEKRVNAEIQHKLNAIQAAAEQRAEEAKKEALAAGRTPEEVQYFTVRVNYEIKSSNESTLSFVINDTESFANTYTEQTFYNIDMKTGKELTLTDVLGKDYKDIVYHSLKQQIQERTHSNPQLMFYRINEDPDVILDHLKFYINSAGNAVVSFDKGEIAPPPMGIQDFEINK